MRLDDKIENKNVNAQIKIWPPKSLFNIFFIVLFLTLSIIILNWPNTKASIIYQIAELGFKLQNVEINGRNHTTHQELIDALKLKKK